MRSYTWGRMESSVLLEEPETLGAELLQEEEAEAKVEAGKTRPPTDYVHGRFATGRRSSRICGSMANPGRASKPIWRPRGLRRRARRSCKGSGNGFTQTDDPGKGHDFHGRPSRHTTDGLRGAWPARCTPSRQGRTSQSYGGPGLTSPPRSGYARHIKGWQETGRPTNTPRL